MFYCSNSLVTLRFSLAVRALMDSISCRLCKMWKKMCLKSSVKGVDDIVSSRKPSEAGPIKLKRTNELDTLINEFFIYTRKSAPTLFNSNSTRLVRLKSFIDFSQFSVWSRHRNRLHCFSLEKFEVNFSAIFEA